MTVTPSLRVFEAHAIVYRNTWRGSIAYTFLNPLLFLLAMGVGLGTLVDERGGTLDGVGYLAFLAPGLLAASAMQTAANDCSWPVMAGIKWRKTYQAALSTPLGTTDLVLGHLAWVGIRLLLTTTVFVAITALFGAVSVGPGLLALIPALATGMAFATAITAFTARLDSDVALSMLFRFGIVPLFLFSGTFFPISQLPGWMHPVAYATPLWHGVDLARSFALGIDPRFGVGVELGYLGVWIVAGTLAAIHNFERRLVV